MDVWEWRKLRDAHNEHGNRKCARTIESDYILKYRHTGKQTRLECGYQAGVAAAFFFFFFLGVSTLEDVLGTSTPAGRRNTG